MSVLKQRPPVALVGVLAIAAFLLVTTGFATADAGQKEAPRKKAVVNQILSERQNVDDLDKAVAQLRSQVETAQDSAGKQNAAAVQERQQQQNLAALAGTTAASGAAVIVKVSDAPKSDSNNQESSSVPVFGTDRVQDHDLQLIVNELFASGAQAVAINDNRVTAVTPIRAAGATIVVNYRPISSPYEITAIGANKSAFEHSQEAANLNQWKKQYKLGYSVKSVKKAQVPAYSGRVNIEVAQSQSH